jgi:hypothetical protein
VNDYRETLRSQVFQYFNTYPSDLPIDQEPAWIQIEEIPIRVVQHAQELNFAIDTSQWRLLTPLQRFALIKLSTSNHENNNFLPALQEFRMLS